MELLQQEAAAKNQPEGPLQETNGCHTKLYWRNNRMQQIKDGHTFFAPPPTKKLVCFPSLVVSGLVS